MADGEGQSPEGGGENPPEPNDARDVTEGGAPTGPPTKDTESAPTDAGGPAPSNDD